MGPFSGKRAQRETKALEKERKMLSVSAFATGDDDVGRARAEKKEMKLFPSKETEKKEREKFSSCCLSAATNFPGLERRAKYGEEETASDKQRFVVIKYDVLLLSTHIVWIKRREAFLSQSRSPLRSKSYFQALNLREGRCWRVSGWRASVLLLFPFSEKTKKRERIRKEDSLHWFS